MSLSNIVDEVRNGNYLHEWMKLTVQRGFDTLELFVSKDALKIKFRDEWIRPSVNPLELAEICAMLKAEAITPYLLDLRFRASDIKNPPSPRPYMWGKDMMSEQAMLDHSRRIDKMIKDQSGSIGNVGKHWVYPLEKEELYGWHVTTSSSTWNGIKLHKSYFGGELKVIQPRSSAHSGPDSTKVEPTHEDYSMTCVMVADECYLNGKRTSYRALLHDVEAIPLVWGSELPPAPKRITRSGGLERGDKGDQVLQLQNKLISLGLSLGPWGADRKYGPATEHAVKQFQQRYVGDGAPLPVTGAADERTLEALSTCHTLPELDHPALPKCPFLYLENAQKQILLGEIQFKLAPSRDDPERIQITNGFLHRNLIERYIPQLENPSIIGAPKRGRVWLNKRVADQIIAFFEDVEHEGKLGLILSWDGLGNTRLMRGYREPVVSSLSAHAWYSAFDINYSWNKLGAEPADWHERGTVKPLVEIAYRHGIGWGGTFRRRDGMHFEVWDVRG